MILEFGESLGWWRTLSERIRTLGEIPFESVLLEAIDQPVYQKIASKVEQLQRLGLGSSRIAKSLGVSNKTVARAIKWQERIDDL